MKIVFISVCEEIYIKMIVRRLKTNLSYTVHMQTDLTNDNKVGKSSKTICMRIRYARKHSTTHKYNRLFPNL